MKKLFITAIIAIATSFGLHAQNRVQAYLQTDLTSAYLWRGQKNAGVSIQPVLGMKWRGLHLYFWGNEQLSPPAGSPVKHEIDLFLKYTIIPQLTVGLKDVYVNTRGEGLFSFGHIGHAANGLEVLIAPDFKFVNLEWATSIAGYDGYSHSGKRDYGSYLTINVPFKLAVLDWNAQVGIVPYYCSRYTDDRSNGFHVNMCALKTSYTFKFPSSGISVTPYGQVMVNPSAATAYFQVGGRFYFNPSEKVKKVID